MVLTLHHLGISQSERIVFLLEELGIEYKLVKHVRDPFLSPESLKSIPGNATGQAPFLEDPEAGVTLSESGAIAEYVMAKYAGQSGVPKLYKTFSDKNYVDYIYWFHWANAGLQPAMLTDFFFAITPLPADNQTRGWVASRYHGALQHIDERLKVSKWLAGEDFTAADCMVVYTLSTQRYFLPVGYEKYPNIVRFLRDVGEREAYRRAMKKGDPEMRVLLGSEAPENSIAGEGVNSSVWKK